MPFDLIEISITVVADSHNPTLLHPAFLSRHQIVPEAWQPVAESTICSLPFSVVQFTNGVAISAESQKLQVRQQNPAADPRASFVSEIARRYVHALPEVRYSAVGINFASFTGLASPAPRLVEHYLPDGMWNQEDLRPVSLSLKLKYERPPRTVNVMVDPGKHLGTGGVERTGVILRFNFHRDLHTDGTSRPVEQVEEALNDFSLCASEFESLMPRVLGDLS